MNTKMVGCVWGVLAVMVSGCAATTPVVLEREFTTHDNLHWWAEAYLQTGLDDASYVPMRIDRNGAWVDEGSRLPVDPGTGRLKGEETNDPGYWFPDGSLASSFEAAAAARPKTSADIDSVLDLPLRYSGERVLAPVVFIDGAVRVRGLEDLLYTSEVYLNYTVVGDVLNRDMLESLHDGQYVRLVFRQGASWYGFEALTSFALLDESGPNTLRELHEVEPPMFADAHELTLSVSSRGVDLATEFVGIAPLAGCPAGGPTVCTRGDVRALVERFEAAGDAERGERFDAIVAAYDLRSVYNTIAELNGEGVASELRVVFEDELPAGVMGAVIRAVHTRREGADESGSFADDASFEASAPAPGAFLEKGGGEPFFETLFLLMPVD